MRRATGARVEADHLELHTRQGTVYTDITFTAHPGTITTFHADSGTGRTALLLTLAARMTPTSGTLTIDGHPHPKKARTIRHIAALAHTPGVNDLDNHLRVHEHLTERHYLRLRPANTTLTDTALTHAGLADLDTTRLISDLTANEKTRLGIALALIDEPRLLLIDNIDNGLSPTHRTHLWHTLTDLAHHGLTIITTTTDPTCTPTDTTLIPLTRPDGDRPRGRHSGGDTRVLPLDTGHVGRHRLPERTEPEGDA
ncbi:ABC-type multidrug transport system ATPase subunit [Nocardiopsis mwathae]|uniref:ABC-type multidrug transport system ATPase subunit n=1 Tax=Nocardiopsis mwathae TaxID=1472723 RepID=A0A7W9YDR9_9ACTN|nr:ATP-binding cassette domain-containing protein [Nocardiopsis mwathae]MBB6170242.1 ABC-type multidrug transport system ATPase subunit [Nocardiopsis mwathae]